MSTNRRFALLAWMTFAVVWHDGFVRNTEAQTQTPQQYFFTPASLATNPLWLAPPHQMRISLGAKAQAQWRAPISGLQGDLYRWAVLRTDCSVSSSVVLQIQGAIRQILVIDETVSRPAAGMPASGTTSDVGDFYVATIIRLWENPGRNLAFGFSVDTRLPNSTQRNGIGTNTTDVFLAILASKRWNTSMIFGSLGIGILTAPLETDLQNDVLLYGLGAIWKMQETMQLFGEINGYLTTRNIIPIGTEARGELRAGCARQFGAWAVEAGAQYGLTRNEGKWGVMLNVARNISWRKDGEK